MNIYFDIETIPCQSPSVKSEIYANITAPGNYKKQESIDLWLKENRELAGEEEWRKTSFDGALGQVCSIAVAVDDNEPVIFYSEDYSNSEKVIIEQFFDYLINHVSRSLPLNKTAENSTVFVGHNVVDFDLRFLYQRCVVLGIKPPSFVPFNVKAWDTSIFDTMTAWAGLKNRVSLDKLSSVLDAPTKGDIDGSKVWDYVEAGKISEVAKYNVDDVERTRIIHRRLTFC